MRAAAHNADPNAADDLAALLAEEEAAGWLDDVDASSARAQALQDLADTADLPRDALPPRPSRRRRGSHGKASTDHPAADPAAQSDATGEPTLILEALEDLPAEEIAPLPRGDRPTSGGRRGRRVHRLPHEAEPAARNDARELEDDEPARSTPRSHRSHRRSGRTLVLALGAASVAATAAIAAVAPRPTQEPRPAQTLTAAIASTAAPTLDWLSQQGTELQAAAEAQQKRQEARERRARTASRQAARRRAERAAQRRAASRRAVSAAAPAAASRPSVRVAPAPRISQPKRHTSPAPPACELGPC